jgi:integrase/recombinase XerD
MPQAATLSEQQLARLLNSTKQTRHAVRNRLILLFTHWAGMRVGEVAALLWRDVVDERGEVREQIQLSYNQTKGSRGRVVLVNQKLRQEIQFYTRGRQPRSPLQPFFSTERSVGFTADTLTHVVNGLYRRAAVVGVSSHSGRRSFLTNLSEQGISARVLQQLAGHRNLATTQRYIDVKPSMLRAAVELA